MHCLEFIMLRVPISANNTKHSGLEERADICEKRSNRLSTFVRERNTRDTLFLRLDI